jgi:hypothetical protein
MTWATGHGPEDSKTPWALPPAEAAQRRTELERRYPTLVKERDRLEELRDNVITDGLNRRPQQQQLLDMSTVTLQAPEKPQMVQTWARAR